jgi:hypothetical protein
MRVEIYDEKEDEDIEKWDVSIHDGLQASDLVVRVFQIEDFELADRALFTFELKKLLLDDVEGCLCLDGCVRMTAQQKALMLRRAANLELLAQSIRVALQVHEEEAEETAEETAVAKLKIA